MAKRPLVVDVSEENKQLGIQPMNVGGVLVTTGPEIVPIAPLGGTYWVDNTYTGGGSDGSDERPFTTIAAGLARIAAQALPTGTLLMAGNANYTAEGVIAIPDAITARIFAWGTPSQQPVSLSLSGAGISSLVYLHGCNVVGTFHLGDCIVQTDMTSIEALNSSGSSTLVMRGGSSRLTGQVCRLGGGTADDVACTNIAIGGSEEDFDVLTLRADGCTLEAGTILANELEIRTTRFLNSMTLDATTILMDRQSERSAAVAGARPTSLPTPLESINPIYGTGATGNLTQSAGSILLAAADEYDNLTINGTGGVRLEFSILRVRNLLNLANAPALAIRDYTGGGGGDAAADVGGASWGGVAGYTQGNSGTLQAQSGANGGTGAGAQPTNVPTLQQAFGGKGGGGGAGGAGSGGAGGAARAAAAVTLERVVPHWPITWAGPSNTVTGGSTTTAPVPIMGSCVGQAGSAGGGDGAAGKGGGGGGSGRGGGSVVVYARGIELGAGTAVGAVSAAGQNGGKGGTPAGAASGGGGGGAGSGGGLVLIAYDWIIGTQPAGDEVNASGGVGGAGGNGTTSGTGGNGGDGGNGGQIVFWNLLTNTRTIVNGAAGGAGGAAVGNAGGAGGTAGACTADFPS
ncbi:MAG TPA: hypothetical protein VF405_00825 [Gammaproteobacteria bacterium]